MIERPFKNFLNLVLFPNRTIFDKQKDVDDDDSEEEEGEEKEKNKESETKSNKLSSSMYGKNKLCIESDKKIRSTTVFMSLPAKCITCLPKVADGSQICDCDCMISKNACICVLGTSHLL